jgi:omega-6 fatty acid desaturase (delta-12 desaturase)
MQLEQDPVVELMAIMGPDILDRINTVYEDSITLVGRILGERPGATAARVVAIDSYGIDLVISEAGVDHEGRVEFPEPVPDALELTDSLFGLVALARQRSREKGLTTAEREMAEQAGNLLPVLRVIPDEAYDNPTWKGLAYFGRDLLIYALAITGLVLFDNPIVVVALWVLLAANVAGLFIVGHDAAHQALFKSRRMNTIVGHLAMLPSWHIYEAWVLGHNRVHHTFAVQQDLDPAWQPSTPEQYAAMSTFQRARHRLDWSWLGAGTYYLRSAWWNRMVVGKAPARWAKAFRRDRLIILAWVVATCGAAAVGGWAMYGTIAGAVWLPFKVCVVPFLLFMYVIGSFIHVHHITPDIRWWKREEWTKFRGQMEGTTILRGAPGHNLLFHWIMIHIPHHVDMRIPMYNLELAANAIRDAFPDTIHDERLRFRDYVRNTRQCKLYDFDGGRWLTYEEARSHPVIVLAD